MGTINSNGIFVYDDTESLSPLSSYMNLQGSALSTRLAQDVRFKKVANEAARTAYVNEVGVANISAANPLAVHRQNAPEGLRFEVTYNGTAWDTIASKGYYEGVVDEQVLLSGGNSIILRRIPGRVVTITANTGTWVDTGGNNVINFEGGAALVPEPFRPPSDVYGSGIAGDGDSLYMPISMTVRSSGAILLTKPTNAISGMTASVTYVY